MRQTLVLASDMTPVKIIPWHEAFAQIMKKSAHLVLEYPSHRVRAGSRTFHGEETHEFTTGIEALRVVGDRGAVTWRRPSVIREAKYYRRKRVVRFSRENIWIRDGGKCQYCGLSCSRDGFTYDHVVPKIQGGKTVWDNIVMSCYPCNKRKGGRTPDQAGMPLLRGRPKQPTDTQFGTYRPCVVPGKSSIPEEWKFWLAAQADPSLYWNVSLIESGETEE